METGTLKFILFLFWLAFAMFWLGIGAPAVQAMAGR